MTKLSPNEIGQIVRREIDLAVNEDGSTVTELNRKAIAYYEGRMNAAAEGRSQAVSYDVADTIHALMANIQDNMLGTDIEFMPESEEDERSAQLETDVIKSILRKNDVYKILYGSCFDALLMQNGWLKVSIKEDIKDTFEEYEFDAMGLLALQRDGFEQGHDIKVESSKPIADSSDISTVKIKRTITTRSIDVYSVAPENMVFSQRTDADSLDDLIMIGERKYLTVSELIDLGIDKKEAESLPSYDSAQTIVGQERNLKQDFNTDTGDNQTATTLKEVYCLYVQIDMMQDGHTSLHYVIIGRDTNKTLIIEPVEFHPFVTGTAIPMPHRIIGQSIYEIMKGVQDQKTTTLRQYFDNLDVANNSRTAYLEGKVNMGELLNGRINGYVGVKRPDALIPLPSTDITAQCLAGLNYMDEVRSQRGGAALDMTQGEMQIANSSATAAVGEFNAKEKMSAFFLGNLCKTLLTGVYLKIHRTLREQWGEPINAKVRGKWQEVNPSEWQPRMHVDTRAGLTSAEKRSRTSALAMLMQHQQELIAGGMNGVLTDQSKHYNAMADWIRSSDIDNVEEYIIDPQSPEAQQAAQQMQQQQQEQAQKQEEMQKMMVQIQTGIEEMKDETLRWKTEQELQYKYFDSRLDAEIKETDMTLKAVEGRKANNGE